MQYKPTHSISKIIVAAVILLTPLCFARQASAKIDNPINLTVMSISGAADLGTVTFSYALKSANRNESVGVQVFAHHTDRLGADDWPLISATGANGGPLVVQLYKGLTVKGAFTAKLAAGNYGQYRLLLFDAPDGHNPDWAKAVYDSADNPTRWPDANLHLTVATSQVRVTDPTLVPGKPHVEPDGGGTYTVTIRATVEIPAGYTGGDSGFWAMAKGSGGFSQVWAGMNMASDSGNPNDHYRVIPVVFRIEKVKAGVFNLNFGLFHPNFGDPIVWEWPGLDFETGGDGWVVKAPADSVPPRIHVKDRKFVTDDGTPYNLYPDEAGAMDVGFIRGGNYGNTLDRDIFPKLNTVGYFIDLREAGCRFVRVLFAGDRYADDGLYQHAVDQVVQNIMAAGIYPLISPQDLPEASTLAEREDKGLRVVQAMARKYDGLPVWIEVDNEPHQFSTWAAWKPVAERYVKAVRAIDPDAFVVVPFEGWSKDGRAAAADPITSTSVDLYDGHAYVDPAAVATGFATAGKAGLPVLVGEYGGSAAYLHKMDYALQTEGHAFMAVSPWAFTVEGQDRLPLIKDGDTAVLQYTEAGQVIANDFAKWNEGKRITETLDMSAVKASMAAAAARAGDGTSPPPPDAPGGPVQSSDMICISKRTALMVAVPTAAGVAIGVAIGRRLARNQSS